MKSELLEIEKQEIISQYDKNWDKMISEWKENDSRDSMWLMFSACYLFKTNNVRWALDPVSLFHRLSMEHKSDFVNDLQDLSFVLISHLHIDHFDRIIVNALSLLDIKWLIPASMVDEVIAETELSSDKIVIVHPGKSVSVRDIKITAFNGYHYSESAKIDSVAYYIETDQLKMFFPGDVRTYDKSVLPELPNLDYLFAHLWLGYEAALEEEFDLLEPFCEFSTCLNPATIIITHLFETARENHSYWNMSHAKQAIEYMKKNYPDIETRVPLLTEKVVI